MSLQTRSATQTKDKRQRIIRFIERFLSESFIGFYGKEVHFINQPQHVTIPPKDNLNDRDIWDSLRKFERHHVYNGVYMHISCITTSLKLGQCDEKEDPDKFTLTVETNPSECPFFRFVQVLDELRKFGRYPFYVGFHGENEENPEYTTEYDIVKQYCPGCVRREESQGSHANKRRKKNEPHTLQVHPRDIAPAHETNKDLLSKFQEICKDKSRPAKVASRWAEAALAQLEELEKSGGLKDEGVVEQKAGSSSEKSGQKRNLED